jgi:hypothetical protein
MKTFKLIVLIGLIFAAGFLGGVVTTRIAVRHFIQRAIAHPELVREWIERGLDRRLKLDTEQQTQVHEILLDAHTHISDLHQQYQPQFAGIIGSAQEKISAILTPEQQKQFERYREEHREIFRPK